MTRWFGATTLMAADAATAVMSLLLGIALRERILPSLFGLEPFSPVRAYASLWPVLILLVLSRALFKLYPGYGMNPAEELRRQSLATAALFVFVLAGSALFQFSAVYSRVVLSLTGALLLLLLPLARLAVKRGLSSTPAFGEPLWIIGTSPRAEELRAILEAQPLLGLRVVGQGSCPPPAGENGEIHTCLLVPDDLPNEALPLLLDQLNQRFQRVWLVPNLLEVASVWITPRDLQGHLALELRNNLLEPRNVILKRAIDLLLSSVLALLALPVMLIIGLLIRLDSPGPLLLRQRRLGRHGRPFTIYKFRTMHRNAQVLLEQHLDNDEAARQEWEARRKLRRDPRVTRVGRVLRRLSLDELPQLWNVLRGEMSLVGPRPIMPDEIARYGERAHLYTQVLPGLTGLVQVSGRSNLAYERRVRLDAYYSRNWSVWLDVLILARTLVAVMRTDGAY